MMKKKNNNSKESLLVMRVFFLGIFGVVIIMGLTLMLNSNGVLFSPDEGSTINYNGAVSILNNLGPDGVEWYCGNRESYTDPQGNSYGARELEELRRILGNEIRLRNEFCRE